MREHGSQAHHQMDIAPGAPNWSSQLGKSSLQIFHSARSPRSFVVSINFLACLRCFLPRIKVIDAMVEPIGLASGLLALAGFAFQATITLLKTVQSYQFHPKNVRDLKEELEALGGVLSSLTETVHTITDVDLSPLKYPLLRCGSACEDFGKEIMKCSSRSGDNRTSFRDWAKLRYMGDNIDGFRQLLAGYKSTIIVALTDANL